jgi:hypothetical protein
MRASDVADRLGQLHGDRSGELGRYAQTSRWPTVDTRRGMTSCCLAPVQPLLTATRWQPGGKPVATPSTDPATDPYLRLELLAGLRPGRDPHRHQQHAQCDLDRLTDHQPGVPRAVVGDGGLVTNV